MLNLRFFKLLLCPFSLSLSLSFWSSLSQCQSANVCTYSTSLTFFLSFLAQLSFSLVTAKTPLYISTHTHNTTTFFFLSLSLSLSHLFFTLAQTHATLHVHTVHVCVCGNLKECETLPRKFCDTEAPAIACVNFQLLPQLCALCVSVCFLASHRLTNFV